MPVTAETMTTSWLPRCALTAACPMIRPPTTVTVWPTGEGA